MDKFVVVARTAVLSSLRRVEISLLPVLSQFNAGFFR